MKTLFESILDIDTMDRDMDDMIIRTHIWNSLIRMGRSRTDTLNKLREEIFDKKCKKITLPLSSQRNKTVPVDSNKYYIYFVVNYAQNVIMMAMAYGDEKLYLIDYSANQDGIANRFALLTPSKLKKDLSHNGRGELYEAPNSLIWLYEKIKKETGY